MLADLLSHLAWGQAFGHGGDDPLLAGRCDGAASVVAGLFVERGALGLPFVPHSTEDCARVEADTEADEEGDQRQDNACRAIASLT